MVNGDTRTLCYSSSWMQLVAAIAYTLLQLVAFQAMPFCSCGHELYFLSLVWRRSACTFLERRCMTCCRVERCWW